MDTIKTGAIAAGAQIAARAHERVEIKIMKFARNWLPIDLDQEGAPAPLVSRLWRESPRSKQNKGADQQTCSKGAEPESADRNDAQEDAKPPLKFIV